MRWVLDTNVLVSALIWEGTARRLLEGAVAGGVEFYTSPALLQELDRTLHHPKLLQAQAARRLVRPRCCATSA